MPTMIETGRKEHWESGETAWFEYHCLEAMKSNDWDLWLRSHSEVEVLGESDWEEEFGQDKTIQERAEAGMPKMYEVRFSDGHIGHVFEDELFTSPKHWNRDDPPSDLKEKHDIEIEVVDN